MNISQLKYFSHAAKTENFSHTAQNFMVPTSGVSASIKALEDELGVKLFDRTANKIKLNEYGRILLQAVDQSEKLLKKAKADILDLSQTPCGELKLLILTNRQKVTKAISAFKSRYPHVSFVIHHQGQTKPSSASGYDVIVTDQTLTDDHFDQRFWLKEEIFLAVHKQNGLAKKDRVSANDLKNQKFVCMPKGSNLRQCADAFFEQKQIQPEIVIECDDPQYIRNYLEMGLGVTFFPGISWKAQTPEDIVLLRINEGLYRTSYIYINRSSSKIAHLFSQLLETG